MSEESEIPECPDHKLPMKLIEEGLIMKTYKCVGDKCNHMQDVIIITMKDKEKKEKLYKHTYQIRRGKDGF